MKRLTMISLFLMLVLVFAVANAETSPDAIREWIDGDVGEGETITSVELADNTLSVVVELGSVNELYDGYIIDLATDRASSITDTLLDHPELDAEWEIIYINFENVGYFFFTKDDIETNEYNMRYMNVYDDEYNSRITTDGEAPAATPEPDVSTTVIEALARYRIGEYYDDTEIDSITINDDLGTDVPGDYIVLVKLIWNGKNSGAMAKETLKVYSDDLAASLYEGSEDVQEIAVFWTVPYLNNGNGKCAYERKADGMYLTDEVWTF